MANKSKPGIKYYSKDSNNVLNKKIKLLFAEFDSHGPWVWECLCCEIYEKKGYYFDINDPDELMLFASDVCKKPVSLVKEIINGCVRRGLFDEPVFNMFKVLTSDRIQSNYLDGTREPRKKSYGINIIKEYWIIEIGENEKAINVISINSKFSRENLNFSQEKVSKVEEIKLDEIRAEEVYTRDEGFELKILKFFNFNQIANPDKMRLISECCLALVNSGQYEYFVSQFGFYSEFTELIGLKYKHSFYNYLGKQDERFQNGAWNAENWEQKLREEKKKAGVPKDVLIPDMPDDRVYDALSPDQKKTAREKWLAAGHRHQTTGYKSQQGWYFKNGTKVTPIN